MEYRAKRSYVYNKQGGEEASSSAVDVSIREESGCSAIGAPKSLELSRSVVEISGSSGVGGIAETSTYAIGKVRSGVRATRTAEAEGSLAAKAGAVTGVKLIKMTEEEETP
ncbi:unnamed protein product [Ilex paraguariensis]|uniref:Uncharacterized protein n=1 Tax=Ilex paraguariensis TaxID=185542 RepID=A0ABC8RP44_9AQUA